MNNTNIIAALLVAGIGLAIGVFAILLPATVVLGVVCIFTYMQFTILNLVLTWALLTAISHLFTKKEKNP